MIQKLLSIGVFLAATAMSLTPASAEGDGSESSRFGTPVVVVELFTSQGCSSCPPADAIVTELAERDEVLPLSLHVDYWDYIGWKDAFAQPQFTTRQKAYAQAAGKRTIYTPQMVVQGVDHVVGVKPMKLAELLMRHKSELRFSKALSVFAEKGAVEVALRPQPGLPQKMRLQFVRFDAHERVEINRGENAGRVIDYTNIVTEWRAVSDWDGRQETRFDMVLDDMPTAVILQAVGPNGPGPILSAMRVN